MKKTLLSLFLAAALCGTIAYAATPVSDQNLAAVASARNSVDEFTGKYWMESSEVNKEAFLYGIDTAITIEYFIDENHNKKGKKPAHTLSAFEKGWMTAFKDVSRKEIVNMVNDWFTAHPDQLNRPVMNVIWYELIEPRLKG